MASLTEAYADEYGFLEAPFVVSDIGASMAAFEEAAYPMYDETPVDGLGAYVRAFVGPQSVHGTPIELVELLDS